MAAVLHSIATREQHSHTCTPTTKTLLTSQYQKENSWASRQSYICRGSIVKFRHQAPPTVLAAHPACHSQPLVCSAATTAAADASAAKRQHPTPCSGTAELGTRSALQCTARNLQTRAAARSVWCYRAPDCNTTTRQLSISHKHTPYGFRSLWVAPLSMRPPHQQQAQPQLARADTVRKKPMQQTSVRVAVVDAPSTPPICMLVWPRREQPPIAALPHRGTRQSIRIWPPAFSAETDATTETLP